MIPKAFIAHKTPTRLRLKVPQQRGNTQYFNALFKSFSKSPTVIRTEVNARTASALIYHNSETTADLIAHGIEHNLFIIESEGVDNQTLLEKIQQDFSGVDKLFSQTTNRTLDAKSLLFVGLMAQGIYQLSKGNIVVPAISAFWYAYQLLNTRNRD